MSKQQIATYLPLFNVPIVNPAIVENKVVISSPLKDKQSPSTPATPSVNYNHLTPCNLEN